MKIFSIVSFLSLAVVSTRAFAPLPVAKRLHPSKTEMSYREDLANEIIQLQGDSFARTKSHDENPWRQLLEETQPHETPEKLIRALRKDNAKTENEVEILKAELFTLYNYASQLTTRELELVNYAMKLEDERDSIRQLVGRIFVVMKNRVVNRTRKVLRFLHLIKK